jgi:hypothetical protein
MLQSTVYSADKDDLPAATHPNKDYPTIPDELSGRNNTKNDRPPELKRTDETDDKARQPAPAPEPWSSHSIDGPPVAKENTTTTPSKSSPIATNAVADKRLNREFMDWCKQALGIQTILEIQTFNYSDYRKTPTIQDDDDNDINWGNDDFVRAGLEEETAMTIPVRGLAASRDIMMGETIIRIPVQALFSVTTTIDHDPVLSRVMGPEARLKYGWEGNGEVRSGTNNISVTGGSARGDFSDDMMEIPLLAVALLHHKKLGTASPLSPYLRILERTPVDNLPFLWSSIKLRYDASQGIRSVARGIKRDIKDMYASVVQVLIDEHPDIFGNNTSNDRATVEGREDSLNEFELDGSGRDEWMFSFENFQWAFAIINSRHWQLPIPDLTAGYRRDIIISDEDEQLIPPADMPTDHWIRSERHLTEGKATTKTIHSFLAPVADMLNFGPPCTRGRYDESAHMFEIVASCSFQKGQEVTFWYGDECQDVMIGVYGFTHPMVPRCPSAEDYRTMCDEWQLRAKQLEEDVLAKDELVKELDSEIKSYQNILEDCACCMIGKEEYDEQGDDHPTLLRHEHVRGANHNGEEAGRRRVRKKIRAEDEEDEF